MADTPAAGAPATAPVAPADKPAPAAPKPPLIPEVEESLEHLWVAVRSFKARHLTQLLSFEKGDELEHQLGAALAAKGAPVRPKT